MGFLNRGGDDQPQDSAPEVTAAQAPEQQEYQAGSLEGLPAVGARAPGADEA